VASAENETKHNPEGNAWEKNGARNTEARGEIIDLEG
jgi:hypothetical protein